MYSKGSVFVIALVALAFVGGAVALSVSGPLVGSGQGGSIFSWWKKTPAVNSEKQDTSTQALADIERQLALMLKYKGVSPSVYDDFDKKLKKLEQKGANTKKARALMAKLPIGGMEKKQPASTTSSGKNTTPPSSSPQLKIGGEEKKAESKTEPPLLLKSIGVDLGYFDAITGKAGDFVFTKGKLQFNVLFTEFGFTIPANQSATGANKRNPQPTFLLPLGTKVRALVDGVVVGIPKLYSNDYSIMVAPSIDTNWRYETEHVINPLVKVGDKVVAGQVIAEVSSHDSANSSGYGLVEIGILRGGRVPEHLCPFAYLDPSIKDDVQKKLSAFYKSWEEYRGDSALHNEAAQTVIGCLSLDPIPG